MICRASQTAIQWMKDWLNEYIEDEKDIDRQINRLEMMKSRISSASSPTLSDMPKAPSPTPDRFAIAMERVFDLQTEINELTDKHKEQRSEIERLVSKLCKSDEKTIIRMRYIDIMDMYDITDALFGDKEDFLKKEDSYYRRAHRIHSDAINSMAVVKGMA